MSQITLEDTRNSSFPDVLEQLLPGEEVLVLKENKPIATVIRLGPIQPASKKKGRPALGQGKGTILHMADDFDGPVEELKEYFE
jgi:antitoxin (DNA-binding transcriptional repressor) of toxin-antitoxin stability system